MGAKKKDPIKRFWNKVDQTPGHGPKGDCWVWTGAKNSNGYGLFFPETKKAGKRAHRWLWGYVHGDIPSDLVVRHFICDNPICVRLEHLKLGTNKDNVNDRVMKNRSARLKGNINGNSKFTENTILEIRQKYLEGYTQSQLSKMFDTTVSNIGYIVRGEHWTEVENVVPEGHRNFAQGEKNHSKLIEEQVLEIRRLYRTRKYSVRSLTKYFPVSQATIHDIIIGKRWKHLPL